MVGAGFALSKSEVRAFDCYVAFTNLMFAFRNLLFSQLFVSLLPRLQQ